jgi:tetratricopeptide (TPR) repeat protein
LLQGNEALGQKNYAGAIRFYQAAVGLDSCFVDALNNWGTALHRGKNYAEAVEQYSQALACKPDYLPALLNRANTWFELKQYARSLQDAQQVLQLKDTLPAYFLCGLAHTGLGRYAEAERCFRQVLSKDAGHTESRINLATTLYYQAAYDSAAEILRAVVKQHPDEADAWNTLALVYVATQNWADAEACFNRAMELQPNNAWYSNNRGYLFLMQGELDKARADINRSLVLDPQNAWAYRNKGIYYLLSGDAAAAVNLLEQALQLDDKTEDIHAWLAEAYARAGNREKACLFAAVAASRHEQKRPDVRCK